MTRKKKDEKFGKSFSIFPESGGLLDQLVSHFVRNLILKRAQVGISSMSEFARYWNKSRHAFNRMIKALGISESLRKK